MHPKSKSLTDFFQEHGGVARFSAMLKAGFHADSLASLEKEGKVEKIGRGLYRLIDHSIEDQPDLVMATLQAPRGVICLITALAFHEATDEIPRQIDIAIPRLTHANKIKYPPVKFYRFSKPSWEAGIEEHMVDGHKIRIYSLAKTIADCFKFRSKVGIDVARAALKTALDERKVKINDVMGFAKICRVDGIIKPIMESII